MMNTTMVSIKPIDIGSIIASVSVCHSYVKNNIGIVLFLRTFMCQIKLNPRIEAKQKMTSYDCGCYILAVISRFTKIRFRRILVKRCHLITCNFPSATGIKLIRTRDISTNCYYRQLRRAGDYCLSPQKASINMRAVISHKK